MNSVDFIDDHEVCVKVWNPNAHEFDVVDFLNISKVLYVRGRIIIVTNVGQQISYRETDIHTIESGKEVEFVWNT